MAETTAADRAQRGQYRPQSLRSQNLLGNQIDESDESDDVDHHAAFNSQVELAWPSTFSMQTLQACSRTVSKACRKDDGSLGVCTKVKFILRLRLNNYYDHD
jgi:hypothetical protein